MNEEMDNVWNVRFDSFNRPLFSGVGEVLVVLQEHLSLLEAASPASTLCSTAMRLLDSVSRAGKPSKLFGWMFGFAAMLMCCAQGQLWPYSTHVCYHPPDFTTSFRESSRSKVCVR